jgi:hypothetical protein
MARIALCIPGLSFNYVWVAHMLQLQAFLLGEGHTVAVAPGYTNNIYITRQIIFNTLMTDKNIDYVLWVDDDNVISIPTFVRLLDDLESRPEADAISAWYWLAGAVFEGVRPSVGTFTEDDKLRHLQIEDLQSKALLPIEWAGMGCVLMRRRALDLVGDRPFRPILRDGDETLGFDGDDIAFFHRFIDGGGVMYCDTQAHVPHLKLRAVSPPLQVPQESKKEIPEEVAA